MAEAGWLRAQFTRGGGRMLSELDVCFSVSRFSALQPFPLVILTFYFLLRTSYFLHVRTPTSFLELNARRNVEFGVILCREKCSYGQTAPNAFLAFQENPRSIGFTCMFWGYLRARVIALNLLYAYIKSRYCGMRRHILSRGGNYCVILIREQQWAADGYCKDY